MNGVHYLQNFFYFVMKSDIKFKTFAFEKKQFDNILKLEGRMAKEMSLFIRSNLEFFQTFDNVILYYDNGQHELNRILNAVLTTELSHYDIRKVFPKDYKLFQAADLICTLKLLSLKREHHELSNFSFQFSSFSFQFSSFNSPLSCLKAQTGVQ